MAVRYLNATGTQAIINEIKRRLSLKIDQSTFEQLQAKVSEVEGEIPTKTSELTNDSNFITIEDVAADYATQQSVTDVATSVQTLANAVNVINADSETEGSVDYKIAQAMSDVTSFKIVAALPADPDTKTLYILTLGTNKYGLYVSSGGNWLAVNDYSSLETVVGDNTSGLVKDVADINDTIDAIVGTDTGLSMRDVAEDVASTIPKAITPKGTIEFADLPALTTASVGDMYNVSDAFTTTADFVEGAGIAMAAGSNVYCVDAGSDTKKWDVFATPGIADMSAYQEKTLTSHSGITATTVEGALEEVASNIDDVEGDVGDLQTTVGDATNGLVKDVADNTSEITALKSTVGDSTSGLVKDVADLETAKQPKTLSSPITVDGTSQTTVEGALGAINTALASKGGVVDEVAGHTLLWYAAVADLPATTAGALVTGTRALVMATNQLYTATVTGTSVSWATDSTYHLAVGSDYFHGTASSEEINVTSVGK